MAIKDYNELARFFGASRGVKCEYDYNVVTGYHTFYVSKEHLEHCVNFTDHWLTNPTSELKLIQSLNMAAEKVIEEHKIVTPPIVYGKVLSSSIRKSYIGDKPSYDGGYLMEKPEMPVAIVDTADEINTRKKLPGYGRY